MKRTALKPGKPLARTAGLSRRKAPLATRSTKQKQQVAAQQKAYRAAPDAKQTWCSICGAVGRVERSHYYTQKQHPEHRNNYLNWCKKCPACHSQWEHNKPAFAQQHPEAWATILGQMQALDPVAFVAFRLKNPF